MLLLRSSIPSSCTVAHYGDADPSRLFIFFDGACAHAGGGPFPFAFTTGCLAIDRPE